mgnify:CR=1 FL=1
MRVRMTPIRERVGEVGLKLENDIRDMNVLKTLCSASLLVVMASADARIPVKVETFPLSDVRLTQSPFKHAEDLDIRYLLGLDPDRLLAPYLKGAGLEPKADNYTNWENTGLDGHIGGHYVSALAYMYAATGNEEIKQRLDYMLSEWKRAQDAAGDGYLCGAPNGRKIWDAVSKGDIQASSFGLNGGWVPLYNIHKTYAGLRDAYVVAGCAQAKDMLVKLTDWMMNLTKDLSDEQIQDMLRSEHGGLNEVFADVADLTGKDSYLQLARRFSHRAILDPLLKQEDQLTGKHANTQIPKVIGYKRIADLEGDESWDDAARFFWKTVVDQRSISIGGNSVREHFHPSEDFSSMLTSEQGPETCNTYNMLRLTKMLYQTSADAHYMDYYERALYNHILSTIDPVQGGFVYFTPMRSGHYRVYSQPQTSFWCCVGSGMENHAKYGEMIYAHGGDDLYVNLFIPSVLQWGKVRVEQRTSFPYEEATTLRLSCSKAKTFTVKFRVPEWTDASRMELTVNGTAQPVSVSGGYVAVSRKWTDGDEVRLTLPMSLRAVVLPDGSDNYSFMYGPVVLASRMGKQEQVGLFADDSRGGHIAGGPQWPLQDMPVIVGDKNELLSHIEKVEGKPLEFKLRGVRPERYEGMVLEPFNRLYECRYMVYWPVISPEKLKAQQEELARVERERNALEAATADKVICGEQQPESDHFIQSEQSRTGSQGNRHWRAADGAGWFSYRMKTNGREVARLRVIYAAGGKDVAATVSVDGQAAGILGQPDGKGMQTVFLDLPEGVSGKDVLTVRFAPSGKSSTPRVYEIRLLVADE